MKAINSRLAAATLAIAATFAGAAQAEECPANWINSAEVAKNLLAAPVADWNLPVLQTLGAETVSSLSQHTINAIGREAKAVERNFNQLERRLTRGQNVNWEGIIDSAHPATRAAYEAAAGGTDVNTARQMALQGLSEYQVEAVNALKNLSPAPAACLVVKGGPAPVPAQ